MQLSLQNFSSLVRGMAASVQGACSSLIDLSVGSVLRAILEASASIALWLQYLLLQVLTMTRLATSTGADVDSWVQDFGVTRLSPTYASGTVTLSSFNPTAQGSVISNGATVRTSDGSQSFIVVGGPYQRAVGDTSITILVQAVAAGTVGNVQSGVVTVLGTAIAGIDTVTNLNAFSGGQAAESDAALRLRFVDFINTRSLATEQALAVAIVSVQQDLTFSIQENLTAGGMFLPGNVHVIVDDGTGTPSSTLLASVAAALDPVRPVGTSISLAGPTVLTATIGLTLTIGASVDNGIVQTAINAALTTYINSLGVGTALRISRLAGLCYDTDSNVMNVQNVIVNTDDVDIGGQAGSVVRAGSINIAVILA